MGKTLRRRTDKQVRLASRQIRSLVADRSVGSGQNVARPGPGEIEESHEGHAANGENRHRPPGTGLPGQRVSKSVAWKRRRAGFRSGFGAAGAAALLQSAAVDLAAFVALTEGLAVPHLRITIAKIVSAFIVGFIAASGKQGGLESVAEIGLVLLEVFAIRGVALLFDVAQTDPPHFASAIHAFRPGIIEGAARRFGHFVVYSGYREAAAVPQRVFIKKELFLGQ